MDRLVGRLQYVKKWTRIVDFLMTKMQIKRSNFYINKVNLSIEVDEVQQSQHEMEQEDSLDFATHISKGPEIKKAKGSSSKLKARHFGQH